jgi:hypothetical protein
MSSMPSFDHLHSALGQDWHIHDGALHVEPVKVIQVQASSAMSAQHEAFHLTVEMPVGTYGDQGIYSLVAPDGQAWSILMSPGAPSAAGQARLQASFSYPKALATAA